MTFDPRFQDTTEDIAVKRARVLAQLDLERARRPRFDPIEVLDRRIERLEAAIYSLTDRLVVAENRAALAMERAEAAA